MFRSKIKTKFGLFCILLGLAVATSASAQTQTTTTHRHHKKPTTTTTDPQTYNAVNNNDSAANDPFKGQPRKTDNEVFLGLGLDYFSSFGFQGRYAYRLLPEGFIDGVNDAFFIEGGIGLTLYGTVDASSGVTGFDFLAAGRWDFMMDRDWTFFGELGLGYNATSNSDAKASGVFPVVGVGALYAIDSNWAARADLSYEFFGVGAAYRF